MKLSLINFSTRGSGYTSASSRAQPPHIGDALKSNNKWHLSVRAFFSASSTSLFHLIGINFSFPDDWTYMQTSFIDFRIFAVLKKGQQGSMAHLSKMRAPLSPIRLQASFAGTLCLAKAKMLQSAVTGVLGCEHLSDTHGQHRQGSPFNPFNGKSYVVALPPRGKNIQQRKVMVGSRNRKCCITPEVFVID